MLSCCGCMLFKFSLQKAKEKSKVDAEIRKLTGILNELQKEINSAKRRVVQFEKEIEELQPMNVDLNALVIIML